MIVVGMLFDIDTDGDACYDAEYADGAEQGGDGEPCYCHGGG